jgi:hypothetical protein
MRIDKLDAAIAELVKSKPAAECSNAEINTINDLRQKRDRIVAAELRPYGPGKFSTVLDSYVYGVSLDGGTDDELGSVSENGHWYGLMRHGHSIFKDHDPLLETLTESEGEYLKSCAGAILSEDSQGFVYVEYFATMAELDAKWAEIEIETAHDDEGIN